MVFELSLLIIYRILALIVAVMMIWVMFREKNWHSQVFAALIFVPFALRAAGVK